MNVNEAISYLKGLDLKNLSEGKYQVDNDFYYMIQEYETQDVSLCKMEAHKDWIDIQWIISGIEEIDTVDVNRLQVTIPYNEEKDVVFYATPKLMQQNILCEGSYLVLYPENGHMPKVAVDNPCAVKKCVGKVRLK